MCVNDFVSVSMIFRIIDSVVYLFDILLLSNTSSQLFCFWLKISGI